MVDVNVNALAGQAPTMAPPIRNGDQILPHIRWVPIGKSNCYLDVEKSQSNPIYKIVVDILKHTNFFRAFTASSTIPSIYIQQIPKLIRNLSNVITNDMFQPWRALIKIINLCLTRKTSGFERPRAPVLQILWGVVNRAHLDYAERILEEFTQSIHTFIKDKWNLAQHTYKKKKATLIVILSIRFTKLIIYHLQRKHKFYPRPDSPLHLPNEEPVLGYLKFSAKGTKREVFGMPIFGSLITTDIQGAPYYQEYLAKVAKHQRYLSSETQSDPDSPAPKPTKTAKKSKPTAPKADPRPPVSKPASSKQPEPKPALAKPGSVSKRHKPISSLRSVDESVTEDVPEKEPLVDDEDADVERALEESLKSMYDVPRGPLPPVVIREPDFEKYQPLPEVLGKGKEKEESEEDVPGADAGVQGEGQTGPDPGAQDERQARSNLDEQVEGQAGPDPGNAEASQSLPSPVVHAGSDLEYLDLDVVDVSTQSHPEPMHEVDKPSEANNDKATAETEAELMVTVAIQQDTNDNRNNNNNNNTSTTISTTTKSTIDAMMIKRIGELEHIMGNLIQENKRLEQRLDSHGARLYTIEQLDIPHQNRFRDLPEADMKEILYQCMWETDSYKTHEDYMQLYEALKKSMNHNHSKELVKDLAEARKKKKKSRESPKTPPGSPPHQPPPPPPAGPSRASGSPGASGSSQVPPPPPPPPSTNQEGQSKGSARPSSSKTVALAEYQAWMMTDTRLRLNDHIPKVNLRQDWWKPFEEERPATPEPAWSIPSSDVLVPKNNWASPLASTYSPPPEDSLLAQTSDIAMFMDWFCKRRGITKLKPQDLEGPALEIIKVFYPNIKAACNPDVGLEQMVPDQMRIEEEYKYDIVAIIEVFSMYGYDYMKKIVLRRADLNEHIIAERDFKYLYPSDFEDMYLLNLQGHLNHLPPKDKKILTTTVNIWTRHLVIRQRVEDFQLDRYGVQMIMRFNEIHKFSDGTLQQIDEALDYRVKEFKINRMNPGLNKRDGDYRLLKRTE
uniref:E-beta-farnesene synthase n=1 Tax=Tanacetum cinerariifolium TaxID=118510 RepID=A0A6L2KNT6_TANCI|nr:E-beta-farnesene synthase [Tanacetum cinerariifolium]